LVTDYKKRLEQYQKTNSSNTYRESSIEEKEEQK
jgi:hypothetical protein